MDKVHDKQVSQILDYVLKHNKAYVSGFLKSKSLQVSGTKSDFRSRIEEAIYKEEVIVDELLDLLNRVEGWGNQHIYLFRASPQDLSIWRNKNRVEQILKRNGKIQLLNKTRPIFMPEGTTLASIQWTSTQARFEWVEPREWQEYYPEKNKEDLEKNILWKAYVKKKDRGLMAFDWDLTSGVAMLMIQRLPSGENYKKVKRNLIKQLKPILNIDDFFKIRVTKAITKLVESGEVLNRQLVLETDRGSHANYTSAGADSDVFKDPRIRSSKEALGEVVGSLGNFYWPVSVSLKKALHMKVYAKDHRLGIFGEHLEESVRHVIGRVRSYC